MYINKEFRVFFDDLASKKSSPGGGSVAALMGLQAVSLVIMQGELTIGKKGYEGVEDKVGKVLEKSFLLKKSFASKVDEDVSIFQEIMQCYKLPKDKRNVLLKSAILKSAFFSLEMAGEGLEVLEFSLLLGSIGNKMLKSDAYIALLSANVCIESCFANVGINLSGIDDESIHSDFLNKMHNIHKRAKEFLEDGYMLFREYRKGMVEDNG